MATGALCPQPWCRYVPLPRRAPAGPQRKPPRCSRWSVCRGAHHPVQFPLWWRQPPCMLKMCTWLVDDCCVVLALGCIWLPCPCITAPCLRLLCSWHESTTSHKLALSASIDNVNLAPSTVTAVCSVFRLALHTAVYRNSHTVSKHSLETVKVFMVKSLIAVALRLGGAGAAAPPGE